MPRPCLALLLLAALLVWPAPPAPAEGPLPSADQLPEGARFRFGSVRWRHPGGVRSSALSRDGRLLATASGRSVFVWDLAGGRPTRRFTGPNGSAFAAPGLNFSPDGRRLGYAHGYNFACVWDLLTGKQILRLEAPTRHPSALAHFSADGKEFITGDGEHLRFHDLAGGKEVRAVKSGSAQLLSPDAAVFVRVDEMATTTIGDPRTGKVLRTLALPAADNGGENGLDFSADGKWLATVHMNKAVELRDTATWQVRASFPLPERAFRKNGGYPEDYRVGLARDGSQLYLGTARGLLHRWDVATKKELPPLKAHEGMVGGIHALPDGKTLLTTGADGIIRRWDVATGQERSEVEGYLGAIRAALSPDGRRVVVGDQRGRLDLYDATTGRRLKTLRGDGPRVLGLAFAPDGTAFVLAQAGRPVVQLLAAPSGAVVRPLDVGPKATLSYVGGLRLSPDGRYVCAVNSDEGMRVWEAATGKLAWAEQRTGKVAFAPDGKVLVVAYAGGPVALLDPATGAERSRFTPPATPRGSTSAEALAFSPDGRLLALAVGDSVVLCDARSGKPVRQFVAVDSYPVSRIRFLDDGPRHRVTALAFTPDGRLLLSGGSDAAVRAWEVATGKEVLRLNGHEGDVNHVAAGPDGRTAFSAAGDSLAYLWELRALPAEKKPAEGLWQDLIAEPATAYRAVWALGADPRAPGLLAARVKPVEPVPGERLARLIADLNRANFKARAAAYKELAGLGERAATALEAALKEPPSVEVRQRLRTLLDALQRDPTPEELRRLRAVYALELAGSPEAQAVLRTWAGGASGARLTGEARAALARLRRGAK